MSERTNDRTENIGARRLHTVMERLLDEISFDAPEMGGREVVIDADYVRERLNWPALLPLPAALDALVTGLAFLLLARLVLEPGAQAGGRLLPLGHGGRLLLAPAGIVHRMVGLRPARIITRGARGCPLRAPRTACRLSAL